MLSRWFQRRAEQPPRPPAPPSPPASAPALTLNLIEAQRSQAIIDLAVAGGERYQSTIRDVDAAAGLMIIDEVFPAGLAARSGQALTVTLRWNTRRESFVGRFAGPLAEGTGYQVQLPPTVGYAQRRAAFRLRLPLQRSATASFHAPGQHHYEAAVVDISIAGIRLQSTAPVLLRGGDIVEELQFVLLGQHFHCRAEVRYVNYHREGTEFGAKLLDLGTPQQRTLARAIMQLERQQVQRLRVG